MSVEYLTHCSESTTGVSSIFYNFFKGARDGFHLLDRKQLNFRHKKSGPQAALLLHLMRLLRRFLERNQDRQRLLQLLGLALDIDRRVLAQIRANSLGQ